MDAEVVAQLVAHDAERHRPVDPARRARKVRESRPATASRLRKRVDDVLVRGEIHACGRGFRASLARPGRVRAARVRRVDRVPAVTSPVSESCPYDASRRYSSTEFALSKTTPCTTAGVHGCATLFEKLKRSTATDFGPVTAAAAASVVACTPPVAAKTPFRRSPCARTLRPASACTACPGASSATSPATVVSTPAPTPTGVEKCRRARCGVFRRASPAASRRRGRTAR